MALQLRPRHRPLHNLSLVQFFSSSNTSDSTVTAPPHSDSPESDLPPPQPQPRFSSLFSDVKASLRTQEHSQRTRQQLMGNPISSPSSNPHPQSQEQQRPKGPSLDEIRKGLSEFPPRPTTGEQRHSYAPHMAYENVINRGRAQSPISDSDPSSSPPATTFSSILKSLKSNTISYKPVGEDRLSLTRFKEDLKLKPDSATASQNLFDRKTNRLPFLVGREEKEGQVSKGIGEAITTSGGSMNTDFHKIYSYQELGEKLRNLRRPEKKGKGDGGGGGFSFLEMNERLVKLRELEEKRIESRIGTPYSNLRNSLLSMGHQSEEEKAKKKTARSIDILGHLAPTLDSMAPPQEHLVEKYFHPDNMSSAEKLKIELTKVRDEFKMSESDCGSARVQVAQLTTKIKHLSSTLHKKDKHSRKGLEGMVQKRKTLLRYLRRTDWDSYCLVLSKLGLRDNPAYKL